MTTNDRESGYTDEEMNEMFEDFISGPGLPEDRTGAILARMEEEGQSEWLIPGVWASSLTQVVGQRENGKSTFIRSIIGPLSKGEPVFGIEPTTGDRPLSILVLATDPGAEAEYSQSLSSIGHNPENIAVIYVGTGEIPGYVYTQTRYGAIDLVVMDNLGGFVPGKDLNSSEVAGLVAKKYDPFIREGIPVVLVSLDGNAKTGRSSGSHQNEAKPRYRNYVELDKKTGTLTVTGSGNLGESKLRFSTDSDFILTLEHSDNSQVEEAPKRSRSREVMDSNREIWELAKEATGTSTGTYRAPPGATGEHPDPESESGTDQQLPTFLGVQGLP